MSRTFLIFVVTQIFSLIGSRMTGIAIGIQVFAETGDTAPILIGAFFAELPLMVAGSFTGVLADRWDKRYVIVLGDIGQAVGTLLLFISFSNGDFQLWHLYSVMFIQGIFGAIQTPASESAITLLVKETSRDRANGIRSVGFPLAGVIAPVFAGIVYAVGGLPAVISIDFLTFIVAIVVVLRLSLPMLNTTDNNDVNESFWHSMTNGWRFLAKQRALLLMVLYLAFVFFLINGPLELVIPYMLTLTGDEVQLGILLAAMSGGAFAGGLAITLWGNVSRRIPVILFGYLLHGLFLILYGVVRDPIWLGISVFLVMFPLTFNGALFNTLLQNKIPPNIQGRIFAITGQIFTFTTPISFLLTAYLVDNVLEPMVSTPQWRTVTPIVGEQAGAGMGLVLVIIGIIIVVSTVVIWLHPAIRSLESDMPNQDVGRL
jgi:MFS transporter, DHA3 family, macrolide efflux protein